MKSIITIFLIALFSVYSTAQTLTPTLFSSCGKDNKTPAGHISFSIGETIIPTVVSGGYVLTQGFHQPTHTVLSITDKDKSLKTNINVYPNPTTDIIKIKIYDQVAEGEYYVEVYDMIGKKYDTPNDQVEIIGMNEITLDVKNLSEGQYLVRLIPKNGDSEILDFKIVKVQ